MTLPKNQQDTSSETRQEREQRLDARYRFSPELGAVLGESLSAGNTVPAAVAANATEVAALYRSSPPQALDIWLAKSFGMDPEPAIRGIIQAEVKRLKSGRAYHAIYQNYREQARWEQAARTVMDLPEFEGLAFEQRLGLIVAAAGEELGSGLRPMPAIAKPMPKARVYLSEADYNRRMDELRKQAKKIAEEERRRDAEEGSV